MIDLLATDDARGYGLALALELEGIPFRRVARLDGGGRPLIVARPLGRVELSTLASSGAPTVVVGPLSDDETVDRRERAVLGLEAPIWSGTTQAIAARHGVERLCLPAPAVVRPARIAGEAITTMSIDDGIAVPAVVRGGNVVRSLVDIGLALHDLASEATIAPPTRRTLRGPAMRAALAIYYRAPEALRRRVQRRTYADLRARLAMLGPRASVYPVDGSGWLLLEFMKGLLRAAGIRVVQLRRWPVPFRAAATLTHDLEPTAFAYRAGLHALQRRVSRTGHPASFGLVAGPATRLLGRALQDTFRTSEVYCHGLEHRGETLEGSRLDVLNRLERARAMLANRLGRPIDGFRSPRLNRSPDLLWALDWAGFSWDSSYPDVDRENIDHFGTGVRLCFPYRPPIPDGDRIRPSRCLELPVAAPDCIQPLFHGEGLRALRRAVRAKITFVHETGGLYVGIVHAGVFGRRDARRRGAHLAFVARQLRRPGLWLTSPAEVTRWWRAREAVSLTVESGRVTASNHGSDTVGGLALTIEDGEESRIIALPALPPSGTVTVPTAPLSRVDHGATL